METVLRFLRSLDKRRLIFMMQRLVNGLFPARPYAACGSGICPCPGSGRRVVAVTGIASAARQASVRIGLPSPGGRTDTIV